MKSVLLPGLPPVEITLRRSARTRRFSLRVSRLDGRVTLSLPARAKLDDALAFARDREAWIRNILAARPGVCQVGLGTHLPVGGALLNLRQASVTRVVPDGKGALLVPPGSPMRTGLRVEQYLRRLAGTRLEAACAAYASRLGRSYSRITLRDTRSRWGSCTSDGRLMFSWRLILAPPEVLDYVAAHEVAHLARMDHSPAFWAEVAGLMPEFEQPRRWLREHGQELHGYIFRGIDDGGDGV